MVGWLSQRCADVPVGDDWLGDRERLVLRTLPLEPRRRTWRLGRWTAKYALGSWLSVAPDRIEVLAASDGAPEAWLDSERIPVSVSLSHRRDRAVAFVADAPRRIGCDLELVEPRSGAFVREWLAPAEQAIVRQRPALERPLVANLIWSAKEAAAKVRREGLRMNVRQAVVRLSNGEPDPGGWQAIEVDCGGGLPRLLGWWRIDQDFVIVLAADPAPSPPRQLQ